LKKPKTLLIYLDVPPLALYFLVKVTHSDTYVNIFIETTPKPHICSCCGNSTKQIHDYRIMQKIKDLPFQLKNTYLVLKKRRYVCSCGKKFSEKYVFLARYQQRTTRLAHKIADMLRSTESLKSVALKANVSTSTVTRILDTINYSCPRLKDSISIDEFKGNADTGKYQCILVNPKQHSILDIPPNRSQSHLSEYFRSMELSQRIPG
jgi:transposase